MLNHIGDYIMPLSKCTAVELRPWIDNNNGGIERTAFRFTYEEIVPDSKLAAIRRFTGDLRPRYITLFADRNAPIEQQLEMESLMKELAEKGPSSFPNLHVMSYEQEVLPYCRVYTQNTKNHQINDLIRDVQGNPRIYNTITIHCESMLVKGEEVPINPSNVRYQAEQQRNYFINNDDRNGIRRYYEPSAVMDYAPEDEGDGDASSEIPIESQVPPVTPPPATNKPNFIKR